VTLAVELPLEGDRPYRVNITSEQLDADTLQAFGVWVGTRVGYIYVPATRNIKDVRRAFANIVNGAALHVRRGERRLKELQKLHDDITKETASLAEGLAAYLRNYLSEVRSIEFEFDPLAIEDFVSLRGVKLDDGANTPLDQKGDGVKSLFALALMQFIAYRQPSARLIFGIEEPESHLHPSKVYDVKSSLRGLSANHQVIVSTHSPILVQRDSIGSNIIIGRIPGGDFACCAKPARRLQEIQLALGVKPEDNLLTASVVVVVEGATEEACMAQLLVRVEPALGPAFADGQVRLLSAGGASKMVGAVRSLALYSASCVILADSDKVGAEAARAVLSSGLVGGADVYVVPPKTNLRETEFEDVFSPDVYLNELNAACGVALTPAQFQTARLHSGSRTAAPAKWSDVMSDLFRLAGKRWEDCEVAAKTAVGRAIAAKANLVPLADIAFLQGMAQQIRRYRTP